VVSNLVWLGHPEAALALTAITAHPDPLVLPVRAENLAKMATTAHKAKPVRKVLRPTDMNRVPHPSPHPEPKAVPELGVPQVLLARKATPVKPVATVNPVATVKKAQPETRANQAATDTTERQEKPEETPKKAPRANLVMPEHLDTTDALANVAEEVMQAILAAQVHLVAPVPEEHRVTPARLVAAVQPVLVVELVSPLAQSAKVRATDRLRRGTTTTSEKFNETKNNSNVDNRNKTDVAQMILNNQSVAH